MKIAVSDLRPNPFRDLKRYPIDQTKVDALVASIKDTDFWDNLVARKDTDGSYELAYGIHRLHALKKAHIAEIDIPVRKLSDTVMAKMMAHENQTEWSHSAVVAQETIRAIVKAFADKRIELPSIARSGPGTTRFAPSFTVSGNNDSGRPESSYSAATLSKFLGGEKAGWSESKIEAILNTLATVEQELVAQDDLEGLTTHQADMVARQAKRVAKETGDEKLAKTISRRLADGMRSGTGQKPGIGGRKKTNQQAITYHGAKRAADEMMGSHRRKVEPKKMPPIEKFSEQLCKSIGESFPTETMQAKLDAILQYRDELPAGLRTALIRSLRSLATRATKFADKLEG
jgi:ParB/Sulfiredoxin domain